MGHHHIHAEEVNDGYGVSILGVWRWKHITYVLQEGQWRIQRQHACSAAMGHNHIHAAQVNDGNGVSILGVRRWENTTYNLKEGNGGYSVSMLVLLLWDMITYLLRT